jgi:hypothetical protein
MATIQPDATSSERYDPRSSHRLGIVRLAATSAVAAAVIFILCWLGTFMPLSSPTHAYIGLFTQAAIGSSRALAEGACWSFLFGGLSGAMFALLYNLFARFEPR